MLFFCRDYSNVLATIKQRCYDVVITSLKQQYNDVMIS